ncbi:MAG: hypothetical protein ACE5H2_06205, partial [Terriglobia bacterium]
SAIQLNSNVPEDVRSYFATIQNLWVYAWFAYDLYAVVDFLSFTAIEMALRKRLPTTGKDKRMLRTLLQEAIRQNLIKEKGFSHVRRMRQVQAQSLRIYRQINKIHKSSVPKSDYRKILLETLPSLRNMFAHPRGHTIQMPGQALFQLRLAAEFINQLFPARK